MWLNKMFFRIYFHIDNLWLTIVYTNQKCPKTSNIRTKKLLKFRLSCVFPIRFFSSLLLFFSILFRPFGRIIYMLTMHCIFFLWTMIINKTPFLDFSFLCCPFFLTLCWEFLSFSYMHINKLSNILRDSVYNTGIESVLVIFKEVFE